MQARELDQGEYVRLGLVEAQHAPPGPQSLRQRREIEHHGRIGERKLAEVDGDVAL